MNRRVGGILSLKIGGELYSAKGEFSYDLGIPKRTAVVGADGVHGFSEKPKVPFIEGAITDNDALDLKALQTTRDVTATLELANGKVMVLRECWYASDGVVKSDEGEIPLRLEGMSADEVR